MRSSEWLHALPPSPTVSGPSGGSAPDPWTILVYLVGCGVVCCHFGCFLGDWERLDSEHVSLVCLAASSLCTKPVDSSALLHMVRRFRTSFEGRVKRLSPGLQKDELH